MFSLHFQSIQECNKPCLFYMPRLVVHTGPSGFSSKNMEDDNFLVDGLGLRFLCGLDGLGFWSFISFIVYPLCVMLRIGFLCCFSFLFLTFVDWIWNSSSFDQFSIHCFCTQQIYHNGCCTQNEPHSFMTLLHQAD